MKKFIFLVLVLVGCGSQESKPATASDNVQCAQRFGSYEVDFDEKSGNCGEIPDVVITMTNTSYGSCVGTVNNSANMCQVNLNICCDAGNGYVLCQNGQANWSPDATSGEATLYMELIDPYGFIECSGTYEVDYNQL